MVNLNGIVETTGKALVIAQAAWRRTIGNDSSKAFDDTPEHRAFTAALDAFKDAFFAANPSLGTHEPHKVNGKPPRDPGGAVFRALGTESDDNHPTAPAPKPRMDTDTARSVHSFLRELAVRELGPSYAMQAPRPFDDMTHYDRVAGGRG